MNLKLLANIFEKDVSSRNLIVSELNLDLLTISRGLANFILLSSLEYKGLRN